MAKTVTDQELKSERGHDAAGLLKVLADENRLKILSCLTSGEKCVCQLTEAIDIPQNLMSHHLKVLKVAGLVKDERHGRWIHYSLSAPGVRELLGRIDTLCDCTSVDLGGRCR